jgi:hypothetical protein
MHRLGDADDCDGVVCVVCQFVRRSLTCRQYHHHRRRHGRHAHCVHRHCCDVASNARVATTKQMTVDPPVEEAAEVVVVMAEAQAQPLQQPLLALRL